MKLKKKKLPGFPKLCLINNYLKNILTILEWEKIRIVSQYGIP